MSIYIYYHIYIGTLYKFGLFLNGAVYGDKPGEVNLNGDCSGEAYYYKNLLFYSIKVLGFL